MIVRVHAGMICAASYNAPMARQTNGNSAMNRLIDALAKLPGIGRRSAQRIAFHLLKAPADDTGELAAAINDFKRDLKVCSICSNVAESDPCPICDDHDRDHSMLLVVEQPSEIASMEATGQYRGVYHVLMGRLAPLDGVGPGELNIAALLERVEKPTPTGGRVSEVIIGTNPTLEGDGTAMYLAEQLRQRRIQVTRLARGLPSGASVEMVSKAVLSDALHGRQRVS